jgi:hypothetical protein
MERLHMWDEWYEFARETLRYTPADACSYAHSRVSAELTQWRISLRLDDRLSAA